MEEREQSVTPPAPPRPAAAQGETAAETRGIDAVLTRYPQMTRTDALMLVHGIVEDGQPWRSSLERLVWSAYREGGHAAALEQRRRDLAAAVGRG